MKQVAKIKQVAKRLIIAGAVLTTGNVVADMMSVEFKPFFGADYFQAWTRSKGDLELRRGDAISAKSAFRDSFPGTTVYVGSKFNDCIGVELGWDSSLSSRKKTARSSANAPFAYGYTSKIRREGYHADLVGFLPMDACWELFGSLGVGSVKMKLNDQNLFADAQGNQALLNGLSNVPLSSKRKAVFRGGLGANYMFTDMFGGRIKVGYEGTNALRMKYANGTTIKAFKDTTTLAFGLFARF